MKQIDDKLKTFGLISIVLTVLMILYGIVDIFNSNTSSISKVLNVSIIIALISGLVYTFGFYKKNSAVYYKAFVSIYALVTIITIVISYFSKEGLIKYNVLSIFNVISAICICCLAAIPNLGKKKSLILSVINALVSVVMFAIVLAGDIDSISCGHFVLAVIEMMFIIGKYEDKQSRGTN